MNEARHALEAPQKHSAIIYRIYPAPLVKPDQVVFRINGHEGRVILMDEMAERSVERHRPNFYLQDDMRPQIHRKFTAAVFQGIQISPYILQPNHCRAYANAVYCIRGYHSIYH
jgi:hypothetical protein